jgi:hypothetical protein
MIRFWSWLLIWLSSISASSAASLSLLDASALVNGIPTTVANEFIRSVGVLFGHRPYQGAISMHDYNTSDIFLEATLIKVGPGLGKALSDNGLSSLRKAMNDTFDLGISGIGYAGIFALGFDLKFELADPEEGLSSALRVGYTYGTATKIYMSNLNVLMLEYVMSRRLNFAEPYMGVGTRYMTGKLSIPVTNPVAGQPDINLSRTGSGYTAYALTGVYFRVLGPTGLRIGMEGTYDLFGFSSIGAVFGLGF